MRLKNGTETSARNKDLINKTGSKSITASLTVPQNQREKAAATGNPSEASMQS